jgi:hypothetical protein
MPLAPGSLPTLNNPVQIKKRLTRFQNENFKTHWATRPGCAAEIWVNLGETDVVDRKEGIQIIENIEKLRPELNIHGFVNRNGLDHREVPLLISGPVHDVSAGIPELACLQQRILLFEGAYVDPGLNRGRFH